MCKFNATRCFPHSRHRSGQTQNSSRVRDQPVSYCSLVTNTRWLPANVNIYSCMLMYVDAPEEPLSFSIPQRRHLAYVMASQSFTYTSFSQKASTSLKTTTKAKVIDPAWYSISLQHVVATRRPSRVNPNLLQGSPSVSSPHTVGRHHSRYLSSIHRDPVI